MKEIKITKEEYLKAVEVIEKFHTQINKKVREIESLEKTSINSFIINNSFPNARVVNILKDYEAYNRISEDKIYIEDITKEEFLLHRNAGLKTWNIFEEARRQYLINKAKTK